ncbi:uncharacterized protein [Littorina saxatilis]|uniref:AIG1-type G domain-containing protein n=1 Tax=Littorina saxatilis TaxID=31220 RepID=A0AAN9B6P5_9CAEN
METTQSSRNVASTSDTAESHAKETDEDHDQRTVSQTEQKTVLEPPSEIQNPSIVVPEPEQPVEQVPATEQETLESRQPSEEPELSDEEAPATEQPRILPKPEQPSDIPKLEQPHKISAPEQQSKLLELGHAGEILESEQLGKAAATSEQQGKMPEMEQPIEITEFEQKGEAVSDAREQVLDAGQRDGIPGLGQPSEDMELKQPRENRESEQQENAVPPEEQSGEATEARSDVVTITSGAQPAVSAAQQGFGVRNSSKDVEGGSQPDQEPQLKFERESGRLQCPSSESESISETDSQSRLVVDQAEVSHHGHRSKEDKDMGKYKIFVIGKTGNGKSSLCNKIVRGEGFPTGRSFKPVTTETREETTVRSGLDITVVDTPDISSESESKQKEIVDSWKESAKGYYYMVVLTVRCDARYSPAEYEVYRQIKQLWGHDLVKRLVVAFTFGDTREDQSLDMEHELANVWPELKHVMKDANNRFVVFNNEAGNMDDTPVSRLIENLTRLQLKGANKMSMPFKVLIGATGCMIAGSFVYLVFILANIDPIGAFIDLMAG